MKKLLSVILALTLVLGLASTALDEGDTQVFWYTLSNTYLASVRAALDAKLEAASISYTDQDGNIVETSANGIARNVVDRAKNVGVPVVFFNRSFSADVVKNYENCCFVGTNYEQAGIMQGNMVGDYLLANYDSYNLNGDGVISYVMFNG